MSKKKRYESPLDADLEVFKLMRLSATRLKSAERRDAEADDLRNKANAEGISDAYRDDLRRQIEALRGKAARLRGHSYYILHRRIPAIGRTKAKLLTKPMEFMGGDRSVVEEEV